MEILLNNLETTERARRNLLKYSAFCISALAGINNIANKLINACYKSSEDMVN